MFLFVCLYSKEVTLSTGVQSEATHWRQTALWLEPANCAPVKVGDTVTGLLTYKRSKENARDYGLKLDWTVQSEAGVTGGQKTQHFKLAS